MSDFLLKSGEKIVFIGDSITDCGRRDSFIPYGNGYVKIVIDLITAKYPERKIIFYNKGISGNTIEDLWNRWYDDVLSLKPDCVIVKIGINDIHCTLSNQSMAISPEKFRKLYSNILSQTEKKTKAKLVLIDPFYISNDCDSENFRSKVLKVIPEYLEVVKEMASIYNAVHILTHNVFQNHLKYKPADYFCPEPVHPYLNGHTIIAYELLKKLKW